MHKGVDAKTHLDQLEIFEFFGQRNADNRAFTQEAAVEIVQSGHVKIGLQFLCRPCCDIRSAWALGYPNGLVF